MNVILVKSTQDGCQNSPLKRLTCGILAIKLKIHDNNSIIFPRLLASFKLKGCKIAKYLFSGWRESPVIIAG
jgi:hypothetical protein